MNSANEKLLFKALASSQIGKDLVAYLTSIQDKICDSRNWGKDDTKESTTKAAEYIKTHLISRIVSGSLKNNKVINESE